MVNASRCTVVVLLAACVLAAAEGFCGFKSNPFKRRYPNPVKDYQIDKPQYIAPEFETGVSHTERVQLISNVKEEGFMEGLFVAHSFKPLEKSVSAIVVDGDVERFFGVKVTYEGERFVFTATKLRDLKKLQRMSFELQGSATIVFAAGKDVGLRMSQKDLADSGSRRERQVLVIEHRRGKAKHRKAIKLYVDMRDMAMIVTRTGPVAEDVQTNDALQTMFPKGVPTKQSLTAAQMQPPAKEEDTNSLASTDDDDHMPLLVSRSHHPRSAFVKHKGGRTSKYVAPPSIPSLGQVVMGSEDIGSEPYKHSFTSFEPDTKKQHEAS